MKKAVFYIIAACMFLAKSVFAFDDLELKSAQKDFGILDLMNYDLLRNHNSKKLARDFFEKADRNLDLLKSDITRETDKYTELSSQLSDNTLGDKIKLVPNHNRMADVNDD